MVWRRAGLRPARLHTKKTGGKGFTPEPNSYADRTPKRQYSKTCTRGELGNNRGMNIDGVALELGRATADARGNFQAYLLMFSSLREGEFSV